MKGIRISTLLLLIIIIAQSLALFRQQGEVAKREAELRMAAAREARFRGEIMKIETLYTNTIRELHRKPQVAESVGHDGGSHREK